MKPIKLPTKNSYSSSWMAAKCRSSGLLACNYPIAGFYFCGPQFLAQSWPPHKLMDALAVALNGKKGKETPEKIARYHGSALDLLTHWKQVHLDHNSIGAHFNKVFFSSLSVITITGRRFLECVSLRLLFCGFLRWELVTETIIQRMETGFLLKCFTANCCAYRTHPGGRVIAQRTLNI